MSGPPLEHPRVKRFLGWIEEALRRHLDGEVELLLRVSGHILDGGGKRIRPLLTLTVAHAEGLSEEEVKGRVLPLAAGIEYIHTASLLHDDVVDGAQTRRGKPAAHVVFGNAAAVLTGDYMYANALHLYSVYGNARMISLVSRAVKMMAEGQLLELKKIGEVISEEEYFKVVDGKTSALFAAACAVGAEAAGADADRWWEFGLRLGRAFQLVDDALDYAGDSKKLGKPAGQDAAEGKSTYPLLSVLGELDPGEVKRALLSGEEELIERLVERVRHLGGVEKTLLRAREELKEAAKLVENLKGESAELLKKLVEFVAERTY